MCLTTQFVNVSVHFTLICMHFQTVNQNVVDVDIISLDPLQRGTRFPHKLLHTAIEKDIYYEVGNIISL